MTIYKKVLLTAFLVVISHSSFSNCTDLAPLRTCIFYHNETDRNIQVEIKEVMNWVQAVIPPMPPFDRIEYDNDCTFDGAWCTPHGKLVTLVPGENKRIIEYDRLKNTGMASAHGVTVTPIVNGAKINSAKVYYEVSYYSTEYFSTNNAPNEVETGSGLLDCINYVSSFNPASKNEFQKIFLHNGLDLNCLAERERQEELERQQKLAKAIQGPLNYYFTVSKTE